MKKGLILVVAAIGMTLSSCAAKDVITQDINVLPQPAQAFIQNYFGNLQVDWIKVDKGFLEKTDYEVLFIDGTRIDFDHKGEWKDIDVRANVIPQSLIPDYVQSALAGRYDAHRVVSIERDRKGYEIEMSNGLSLKFNKKGELVEIDD